MNASISDSSIEKPQPKKHNKSRNERKERAISDLVKASAKLSNEVSTNGVERR